MKNCKNFRVFGYIYIYIYLVVQGTLIFNTPPIQSYKNSHLNRIHEHFFLSLGSDSKFWHRFQNRNEKCFTDQSHETASGSGSIGSPLA